MATRKGLAHRVKNSDESLGDKYFTSFHFLEGLNRRKCEKVPKVQKSSADVSIHGGFSSVQAEQCIVGHPVWLTTLMYLVKVLWLNWTQLSPVCSRPHPCKYNREILMREKSIFTYQQNTDTWTHFSFYTKRETNLFRAGDICSMRSLLHACSGVLQQVSAIPLSGTSGDLLCKCFIYW